MNTQEHAQTRKWLTVDQAFAVSQAAGLNRTKKTIRSWCRLEHVESQKQTTPTGERWMVEAASLDVKIQSELEFLRQTSGVPASANPSEPVQTKDEPVRTGTNLFGQEQTRPHPDERTHTESAPSARERELEVKLRSLEIDKAVRDKQIEFFTKQNEEGQQSLLSQSRYIGHLETQVLRLGGEPNQAFLKPPVPHDPVDPVTNHNQPPLNRSVN
ncbi:hypothetical protein [Algirhabdus cladophorae]|uniref:hypothetical protein n=1 Tax=Algirhabdus cladophorae TaxID=3377108 RepID=UPI003B848CF1